MPGRCQVKIGRRERERLADASTRVVQEQQQGVVALSERSAPIRLGENGTHLLGLEVLDDACPGLLASKRENPLVLRRTSDVVSEQVLDEAADGGQPAIAGGRRIAPSRFEIIQEGEYGVDGDVIDAKVRDGATRACAEEQEEKAEGVAIRAHGVCARAANPAQMIVDVGLDENQEPVRGARFHDVALGAENPRRSRRAAIARSWGVAVKYVSVPRMSSCPMYAESQGRRVGTSMPTRYQRSSR